MTTPKRNLGGAEPWGRATENEIEEIRRRLRALEGSRKISSQSQSILADLVAKGTVKDQLLQDQFDFQDSVVYSNTPPSSGLDDPGDPDAGGEYFPAPDSEEGDNPYGSGGDDDPFPPFNPNEVLPTPEEQWVWIDPVEGEILGEWRYIDNEWVPLQITENIVADGAIIREKIDQAIIDEIEEASENANVAIQAANGKNMIFYGPDEPEEPAGGFRPGDTWFQRMDPANNAEYAWTEDPDYSPSTRTTDEGVDTNYFTNPRFVTTSPSGELLGILELYNTPSRSGNNQDGYEVTLSGTNDLGPGFEFLVTLGLYAGVVLPSAGPVTVKARVRIPEGYDASEDEDVDDADTEKVAARSLRVLLGGTLHDTEFVQAPADPGEYELSLTVEAPPGGVTVTLGGSGKWGQEITWLPGVTVVQGEYDGPRFTGATPDVIHQGYGTAINTWDGTEWVREELGPSGIAPDAILETHITDGSISTPKLQANAVEADNIAANAVTAGKIAAGSIVAGDGVIGSLDAGIISAGILNSARIGAQTITSEKLVLGGADNLAPGPGGYEDFYTVGSGNAIIPSSDDPSGMQFEMDASGTTDAPGRIVGSPVAVKPGDRIRIQFYAQVEESVDAPIRVYCMWDDSITSWTPFVPDVDSSGWYEGQVEVPEGRTLATFALSATGGTHGKITFREVQCFRMVEGHLIVNGSITSNEIATGGIEADNIAANAIQTNHLSSQSITADKVLIASGDNMIPWNPKEGIGTVVPNYSVVTVEPIEIDGAWGIRTHGGTQPNGSFNNVLVFTNSPGSTPAGGSENRFPVKGGESYRFQARVGRSSMPSGAAPVQATLRVAGYRSDGTQNGGVNSPVTEIPNDTEGVLVSFIYTAPADVTGVSLYFRHNVQEETGNTRWMYVYDPSFINAAGASLIVDGAITADKIAAGSITANKLLVADMRNFTPGPGGYEDAYSLTRAEFVNNNNDPTGKAIRFTGGTTADGQARGPMLPVRGGEEFYLEARYSWYGSSDTGGSTQLRMEWFDDPDASRIGQSTAVTRASGTSGAYISGTVTAPAEAKYGRWYAYTANQSGPGDAALYDLTCLPRVGGTRIEDGAISADKIAANAVTADKIEANAITAKHTITGATLRTAASGARTQITGSGLQVFNSSNQELVRVGHGISTGMSVRNPSSGSLTPLAPMVFGSVYMHLTGNVTFSAGGNGSWSPWFMSQAGPSISSPTGKVLAILVTRMAESGSGQGEIESYVGLSTTQAPGGHGVTVADLGGSWVTGSANKARAIIASTVGNFPAATMVVLNVSANTTYYPRIRTRALKYTTSNIVMNNQTLHMIPV